MRRIEMAEAVQGRMRVRDIYEDRKGRVIEQQNAMRLMVLFDGDEAAKSVGYGRLEILDLKDGRAD